MNQTYTHLKAFADQASEPCISAQGRHLAMSSHSDHDESPCNGEELPVGDDDVVISTQVQVKSSAYVWYPDSCDKGGRTWIKVMKWDRGFVKFCLGAPMSTRRGQGCLEMFVVMSQNFSKQQRSYSMYKSLQSL